MEDLYTVLEYELGLPIVLTGWRDLSEGLIQTMLQRIVWLPALGFTSDLPGTQPLLGVQPLHEAPDQGFEGLAAPSAFEMDKCRISYLSA